MKTARLIFLVVAGIALIVVLVYFAYHRTNPDLPIRQTQDIRPASGNTSANDQQAADAIEQTIKDK